MSNKSIKFKKVVAASLGVCGLIGLNSIKSEAVIKKAVQGAVGAAGRGLSTLIKPASEITYHKDGFKKVGGDILAQDYRVLDLKKAMDGKFGHVPNRLKEFKLPNTRGRKITMNVHSHGDVEGLRHLYSKDQLGGNHRIYEASDGEIRALLAAKDVEILKEKGISPVKALDSLGREVDIYIVDGETPTRPFIGFESYTGIYRDVRKDNEGKYHLGHQIDPSDLPPIVKERFKKLNNAIDENVLPVLGPIVLPKFDENDEIISQ